MDPACVTPEEGAECGEQPGDRPSGLGIKTGSTRPNVKPKRQRRTRAEGNREGARPDSAVRTLCTSCCTCLQTQRQQQIQQLQQQQPQQRGIRLISVDGVDVDCVLRPNRPNAASPFITEDCWPFAEVSTQPQVVMVQLLVSWIYLMILRSKITTSSCLCCGVTSPSIRPLPRK